MLIAVKYIVVLANEMDATGALNEESAHRAEFAAKLALTDPDTKIVTPGWAYRPDSPLRIGAAMKDHILGHCDVPADNILSHLDSKDTVGDAVYCRELLDGKGVHYSLDVVTSDYHCERASQIFRFVFGDSVGLEIHPVPTLNPASKCEAERLSTEAFRKTFSGINAGDFKAIRMRLLESHPLYINTAEL
jgi:uncharacterized SAM-binding protein YcdF (DUF218 family)